MGCVTAPGTIPSRLYPWVRLTVNIYRNGLEAAILPATISWLRSGVVPRCSSSITGARLR